MAVRAAKTGTFKLTDDIDPDNSPVLQVNLLLLQALCRFEGMWPPRTIWDALVQIREWLAPRAQLESASAKREALEAKQTDF